MRYDQECILVLMWSTSYSCQILINPEFSRQIFDKYSDMKFHEKPSSGSRVVPCGRTDSHDEDKIVDFCNSEKAPKSQDRQRRPTYDMTQCSVRVTTVAVKKKRKKCVLRVFLSYTPLSITQRCCTKNNYFVANFTRQHL
jgi:hypothetical protein